MVRIRIRIRIRVRVRVWVKVTWKGTIQGGLMALFSIYELLFVLMSASHPI